MGEENVSIIIAMFTAYGKEKETGRMAQYVNRLRDLPTQALKMACDRAVLEEKFLPSVADIVRTTKSLIGTIDESHRVKEWDEAWLEIDKAMRSTPWGKRPTFSTKEIESAVNSYGWNALQTSLEKDMPTVRAQVRRMYEDACKRNAEQAMNKYILGDRTLKLNTSPDEQKQGKVQQIGSALYQLSNG